MSRYRKLMSEAITEVRENAGDYLKSKLSPAQIQNIKNTWKTKKASDVTQSVKDMIKKMDIPTQLAIKHADIPHLSKLVEEAPVEIDEGRMKDIYTMQQAGKSAEEIAKKMKLPVSTVKGILGEAYDEVTEACWTGFKQVGMKKKNGKMVPNCVPEEFIKEDQELNEFSMAMLDKLAKEYEPLRGKTISIDNANKLRKIFDRIPDSYLQQIRKKKIPFLSALALSRMIQKGMPVREEIKESTDINFNKRGAPVSYLKRFGRFSPDMKQYRMNGVNMTFWVWQGDDYPGSGAKFDRNKVFQLKLTSAYRPSNDKEYDKMYDVINKWGSERRLGKLNDKDVDIYFEEVIREAKEDPNAPATDTTDEPAGVEIAKLRAKRDEKGDKDVEAKEKEIAKKDDEIANLKNKLENEKHKAVKPQPNPETGEVPLAIGLAQKLLKDKMQKEKEDAEKEKRDNVKKFSNRLKNENVFDMWKEAAKTDDKEVEKDLEEYEEEINDKELEESTAAVRKKAEKSGMPYGILKKVYDRGMAAWRGGHRPGATQVQWALARVNSFVTKSSGTWGGADKDLAKQVRKEAFAVQITKKDGGKLIHGKYKTKPDAEKFIKWYKTGDMKDTKSIEVVKEDLDAQPQDKDVKKKDGTQPKKYYSDLSKSVKSKRADHFKSKDTTKNDNKPAPGDKDAKTKPSIHTKKFKQMYGESDASDKAKGMGLDYMKFGRYGKDGKVTHKNIGGNLTAVDKDEKPIKEPKSKEEPKSEPKSEPASKLDGDKAKKDLEGMVTDGMIDVDTNDDGSLSISKEYEPSQDYEAERDVKAIKAYFKKKGIDPKKMDVSVDGSEEDEYLQISVDIKEQLLKEKNATITINKITKPAVHKQISDVIKKMGSKAPKVTKTANGYVMAGDVKSLTGVVDYLFDKELRNIINPKNPPFDIKMLKNDMSEADLTKSQIKKVHDKADELPKKDFKDRYGKEKGDDVRYAVATNIIKKKLGIK